MKLTKAQNYIMEKAHKEIDFARTHTLIEWATNERYNCIDIKDTVIARRFNEYGYKSLEDAINDVEKELQEYAEKYGKYYYNEKNGVVLTQANSRTLKALERLNLIEIIEDGGSYIDSIKILNY